MAETIRDKTKRRLIRRILRWGAVVLVLTCLAWLAAWLIQRSLHSPANKRAMQSWLDDNLNADVSLIGDMTVRLNLVRDSRLVFGNVEVEHPNPIFPGKLASIGRMGAWCPPWSALRLWSGTMDLLFQRVRIAVEENDAGEWSLDGLMRPLASADAPFPFPVPKISDWTARIEDAEVAVRRHGYELGLKLDAELHGRKGGDSLTLGTDGVAFTFGRLESDARLAGRAGRSSLVLGLKNGSGPPPALDPGRGDTRVEGLPAAILPFFLAGIPLEDAGGFFNGVVAYRQHPGADGALVLEGELRDAPLSIFGLPRNAPLRLVWPMRPERADLKASLHLGPPGFGGFEMNVPLDASGKPRLLSMRGEVAALDDIPDLMTRNERWTDWLSRFFPAVEWRAGKWRGFGWSGSNLRLNLVRTTASLNLTGEAEMLGGRIRLALTPDQPDGPVSVAAERIDAALLAENLSRLFPEPFRVRLSGSHVNFTWRGMRTGEGIGAWGAGFVFAKPEIDIAASGAWWTVLAEATRAVARALPEWGGGDPAGLLDIAAGGRIPLDQLSIVSERGAAGDLAVEFRAYGDVFGQATGMIETRPDGSVVGEFLLAGPSQVLAELEKVNPDLALLLVLLANDSPGLRIQFRVAPGQKPEFHFPFLDDAKSVLNELVKKRREKDEEKDEETGGESE